MRECLLLLLLTTFVGAEDLVSVHCERDEVSVVLQSVADQIGKPLVLDPWVHGKVTLQADEMTADFAIDQALAQLEVSTTVFIGDKVRVEMSTEHIVCNPPPRCFVVKPNLR